MSISKEQKAELIAKFGGSEKNTGSTEAQIAILTHRITELNGHLQVHKKDHSTRRGLLKLVGQRRRFLKYLRDNNLESYRSLIASLNLRK